MLATPATAKPRVHHRAAYPRAYAGSVNNVPNNALMGVHTGQRYNGPYNERIITSPNGIVLGTDPDASIRAYMRRDGAGAGGAGVTGVGAP